MDQENALDAVREKPGGDIAWQGELPPEEGEPGPRLSRGVRGGIAAALVVLALVSFFLLGPLFSSTEFHKGTIDKLDSQRNSVISLMGVATAASAGISAIPDDAGSPIADKLMDVTGDFSIILIAIYLEKYALVLTGILAFRILVPVALVILALLALGWRGSPTERRVGVLALKAALFGILLCCVVPASVAISDVINDTYGVSVESTEQTEATADQQTENQNQDEEFNLVGALQSLVNTATDSLNNVLDDAKNMVNDLLEKFAIMVITSCVMPLLVIAFCIWMVNFLFGINLNIPVGKMRGSVRGGFRGARGKAAKAMRGGE